VNVAQQTIADGRAWAKFQRICEAQGGMRVPATARYQHPLLAGADGAVRSIDNRKIVRLAKLAGAPEAKAAGLELYVQLHQRVSAGEPVCSVHAETPGELRYALDYASANPGIIEVAQQ
jgi:thymidine phosphorylase